jgi:hypothetical protein
MEKRILLEKRGRDANQVSFASASHILLLFRFTAIKIASALLKSFQFGLCSAARSYPAPISSICSAKVAHSAIE